MNVIVTIHRKLINKCNNERNKSVKRTKKCLRLLEKRCADIVSLIMKEQAYYEAMLVVKKSEEKQVPKVVQPVLAVDSKEASEPAQEVPAEEKKQEEPPPEIPEEDLKIIRTVEKALDIIDSIVGPISNFFGAVAKRMRKIKIYLAAVERVAKSKSRTPFKKRLLEEKKKIFLEQNKNTDPLEIISQMEEASLCYQKMIEEKFFSTDEFCTFDASSLHSLDILEFYEEIKREKENPMESSFSYCSKKEPMNLAKEMKRNFSSLHNSLYLLNSRLFDPELKEFLSRYKHLHNRCLSIIRQIEDELIDNSKRLQKHAEKSLLELKQI